MKSKFNAANFAARAAAACLFFICGCAAYGTRDARQYPADPKSLADLRRSIDERASGARPLKLKGRLTYWGGPDEKPRSCLALIIADPSRKLRVKGYRSLGPTLFEAAADGDELLLYTPSSGEISSPRDAGEEAFYGKLLEGVMDTLYLPRIREDEILLMECTPKYYVLSVAEMVGNSPSLKKKLWLDLESCRVAGIMAFDRRGIPAMMATMDGYGEGLEGLPSRLTLLWPADGAAVELSLKSIEPAGTIPPGAFSLSDLGSGD